MLGLAGRVSAWEALVLSHQEALAVRTGRGVPPQSETSLPCGELRGLSRGFGRSVAARLVWLLRSCEKHVCC